MTQNEPIDDESPGTTTRRQYLGAAATLAALPNNNDSPDLDEATRTSSDPDVLFPHLIGYVANRLVHPAFNELIRTEGDMEKAQVLLEHAATLIDAGLVDADEPHNVPHRPEWEVEYNPGGTSE